MYLKLIPDSEQNIFQYYGIPYYVYVSLSNICNANCQFCGTYKTKEKYNKLNLYNLIDELAQNRTKYVHFTGGGEPFVNRDIVNYMEYAESKNIKVVFTSNGLALNESIIKRIVQNIDFCFFSLDGHCAEIHNSLRRTNEIFERATTNINRIKQYNQKTKIVLNHVLNVKNIVFFDKFIQMKTWLNFDFINPIVVKDNPVLFPNAMQIGHFNNNLNLYYQLANDYNIKFSGKNLELFNNDYNRNTNDDIKCVYPSFCAFVDCPTGNVYPCDCSMWRDPKLYKIGNLIESNFTEVWNSGKKKQIQEMLKQQKMSCVQKCDESNCLFNRRYELFRRREK